MIGKVKDIFESITCLCAEGPEFHRKMELEELIAKEAGKGYELCKTTLEKGPKIVTLCGSSRFVDVMAVCAWFIERDEGAIVLGLHLLPFWYSKEPIPDHLAEHEGIADKMDKLHLRKIDISHEIFVVNYEDYIGDSTRAETEYAQKTEKKIRWYSHDPVGEKVQNLITSRFDELKEGDKNIEKDRSACPECEEPTPADAAECSACGCVWD